MIEFEITTVVKAKPGGFSDAASCLAALGKAGEDIMHAYGGRIIKVDSQSRTVEAKGESHEVTERIVLVMKASGAMQP